MKLFYNKDIRHFFLAILFVMVCFFVGTECVVYQMDKHKCWVPLVVFLPMAIVILLVCFLYFKKQNRLMEQAVATMEEILDGDSNARIACEEEGEIYRLFHTINTLASVLHAHADNEIQSKEFLKDTISDISHQLKTPLAALNIYNGLVQNEVEEHPEYENFSEIKEFAALSEQELDRMEMLIQQLLKMTKLDAGSVMFEKTQENVADMMKNIELHFAHRAKMENKKLILNGGEGAYLLCDRNWMTEAVSNLVKNAFDHTKEGDTITMEWSDSAALFQIKITDTGSGIHPEDIHHIFKRFYRSRFSKDTQGVGLGLPLAKAIIEAHDGTIEVDSELGRGTTFLLSFWKDADRQDMM